MTTHQATAPRTIVRSRHRGRLAAPAAAGIAYIAAWVTGLLVWPSNLGVAASGARVVSVYAGHRGVAVAQYLLVEGGGGCPGHRRDRVGAGSPTPRGGAARRSSGARWSRRGGRVAGRVRTRAPARRRCRARRDSGRAATVFHLINRLDGVKMLALAAVALAGVGWRAAPACSRWLGYVGALLAVAMIASGVGYLLLNNTVSQTAAVSLGLLLVWVAGTGLTLGRGSR